MSSVRVEVTGWSQTLGELEALCRIARERGLLPENSVRVNSNNSITVWDSLETEVAQ